jgi:hypothetical protein
LTQGIESDAAVKVLTFPKTRSGVAVAGFVVFTLFIF